MEANQTKKVNKRPVWGIVLAAVLLLSSLSVTAFDLWQPDTFSWKQVFRVAGLGGVGDVQSPMKVHVLDVGKADCILIECEGSTVLIDSGYYDYSDRIINYLRHLGIPSLDLAVLTHADSDHAGTMAKLLDAFPADRLLMAEPPENLEGYSDSYRALATRAGEECELVEPRVDDCYTFGNLYLYVLSPEHVFPDENDNSIVLRAEYKDTSFLFMGDAEKAAEQEMCERFSDLQSDVIKIGHHGSETSTSETLLHAVNPKYAIVSVGEDRNNLPRESVLERLEARKIQVFRTDFDGTCVFASDGETITVYTQEVTK